MLFRTENVFLLILIYNNFHKSGELGIKMLINPTVFCYSAIENYLLTTDGKA